MLDRIKDAFRDFNFLTPRDLLLIASVTRLKRVKKNSLLIEAGDMNHSVYVVLNGLLRHYVIDKDGTEKTLRFAPERHPAGSMDTLINGKEATEFVMALENTILLHFDLRAFDRIASDNIRLLKVQNKAFKDLISADVTHIKFLNVMNAEERYRSFSEQFPHLERRVKQKYLASYLGITPTSLSRLKARMEK